jgi:hypothetical protein
MKSKFTILILLMLVFFMIDIAFGSVSLSLKEVWATLTGNGDNMIYREIILGHRLPKALTAILTGAALAIAGVLMQTLFHNPLAGPDVLGVTSGASLGVALLTMGTSFLPGWMLNSAGQVTAAIIGASLVLSTGHRRLSACSADGVAPHHRYHVRLFYRRHRQHTAKHQQPGTTEAVHQLDLRQSVGCGMVATILPHPHHSRRHRTGITAAKAAERAIVREELCRRTGCIGIATAAAHHHRYRHLGRYVDSLHRSYQLHRHHHAAHGERSLPHVEPPYRLACFHSLWSRCDAALRLPLAIAFHPRIIAHQCRDSSLRSTYYLLDYY